MPRPKKEKVVREKKTSGVVNRTVGGVKFSSTMRDIARTPTKLWSFNQAIGGGIPHRTIMEISGYEYVGKSTLAEHLGGFIAGAQDVALLAFEATDPLYLASNLTRAGFSGTVWSPSEVDGKGKIADHEGMMDEWLDKLEEDERIRAGIWDSVSAFSPVGETEGSVREAHMGLKARIDGNFMRRCEGILLRRRKTPANVFIVNHLHPNLGVPGANTSGGKAIHNHSATRVRLTLQEGYDDGTMLVEGKVVKLRFRGDALYRATFKVVLNHGVHIGLTAVQDALDQGVATKSNGIIAMKGKSFGRHSLMMEKHWNDPKLFEPFMEALK